MKTMKAITAILIISTMFLGGCVGTGRYTYEPVVAPDVKDAKYQETLKMCQELAMTRDSAGEHGLKGMTLGAASGAVAGAIIGAIFHVPVGRVAAIGAMSGGVSGGAGAAVRASNLRRQIVKRCIENHGYVVYD